MTDGYDVQIPKPKFQHLNITLIFKNRSHEIKDVGIYVFFTATTYKCAGHQLGDGFGWSLGLI